MPAGLLDRFVYTLQVILAAVFAAAPRPVGDGKPDAEVYAGHGVDRLKPEPHRKTTRWASLARWVARAGSWWPAKAVSQGSGWRGRAAALLIGFAAGGGGRDGAIARAVLAHVPAGAAM